MIDSTGLFDPGMLDGDLFYEGRYSECMRATYRKYADRTDYPVEPLHCVAIWPQDVFVSESLLTKLNLGETIKNITL